MFDLGQEMHDLCRQLFPICRSITGDGFRQSLMILKKKFPSLESIEVPTGTKCFDWEVPKEWNIKDAYIIKPNGEKICKFQSNNLHVVGYSIPINKKIPLKELQQHLYSIPSQPSAIPYVTSYYNQNWGFCISQNDRDALREGDYQVVIDSELRDGHLTYGEIIIPGNTDYEIFISTYLCHPSMANNELSGPAVTIFLANWIMSLKRRRYTYRIVIIPETIGSIVYLSEKISIMKKNVIAGFNVTCVGDEGCYSYLPSRNGDTLSDKVALHVLKYIQPTFVRYSFLERGSDERQYCSPGVDLPVCSVMRTKYGCYPEYHTSLDDLNFITPAGLLGSYNVLQKIIECLEINRKFRSKTLCEPQLGKRGLYPNVSVKNSIEKNKNMMNFLAYLDGVSSNLDIAEKINMPLWYLTDIVTSLKQSELIEEIENN